ncbi:MAG: sensor histidine kinase [Spirochaetales bacterium]|nr:sensor histidine kinase [Spirochaetales bacterium]
MGFLRNWTQKSLRRRIITPAIILCLIFFILQGFITFGFGRTSIIYYIQKKDSHIIQSVIKIINTFFENQRNNLLLYKNKYTYKIPVKEKEYLEIAIDQEFIDILVSFQKNSVGIIRRIFFMDENYRPLIIVHTGENETVHVDLYPDIPAVFAYMREKWDNVVHNALARHVMGVSLVRIRDSVTQQHIIDFTLPLIQDYDRPFYFLMEISLESLISELKEYELENESITILDRNDNLILSTSPDPSALLALKDLEKTKIGYFGMTQYTKDNTIYTVTYAPVNNYLGWTCFAETNTMQRFTLMTTLQLANFFLVIVSLFSLLFFLSMIIKEELSPVELLSEKVNKIAELGYFSDAEIKEIQEGDSGTGEIHVLINSFSNMVNALIEAEKKAAAGEEKRNQQEQLMIQQSKLAAMGEMISMIAHQWRQPLSSISTIAGNLKVFLDLDELDKKEFSKLLNIINEQSQFLSKTINDFRDFFKVNLTKKNSSLKEVMDKTLGIIGKSFDYKNILVEKTIHEDAPVYISPNELMQVFLNILKNAYDALVENKTSNPKVSIALFREDEYQVVEIEDNGPGIPEKLKSRIFEPYFSTKDESKGTGLGLYMSKTIVTEHCGGNMVVKEKTPGACFIIRIPISNYNSQVNLEAKER